MERRPTTTITLPYGFAHFGKSLFWYASEVLFAFFLTEVCRITPWHMAIILSASIAVNATADTLVGSVLTRRMETLDGAVRLQTWGAVISGISLIGFLSSGLAPAPIRFVYAVATLMLFRLAYAAYDVPQNVILALASRSPADRNTLAAMRIFGSGIAGLVMSVVFVPLIAGKTTQVQALNTAVLAIGMTSCAVLTAFILRAKGRTVVLTGVSAASETAAKGKIGLPAVALLAANLLFSSGTAFFTRLEPYFAAYGAQSRLAGATVMLVIAMGGLVAQPCFALLARRYSTWRLLTTSTLIQIAGCGAIYFTLLRSSPAAVTLASLGYGFGAGGAMMLSWVVLTDLVALSRISAPRIFGLFTFASKLGLALSTLMLGLLLSRGDYHTQWQANVPLISMMTFSPLVGALAYLLFAITYKPGERSRVRT